MVAIRTTGAPRCLRASGCTSCCSHLCSAAIMSQVREGGGEKATWRALADADQLHRGRRSALGALAHGRLGNGDHIQALEQDRAARLRQLDLLRSTSSRPIGCGGALLAVDLRPHAHTLQPEVGS